ncbi:MAG: phosphoglycerate kinase [Gammaproteobacteria bacterium]|nr:phosphoglycerate kinase [Gammaproteobacteria bacterium]
MSAEFITLDDLDPAQKTVLIRADFNVPVSAGIIQDDTRIRACLPTLKRLVAAPAAVILVSHLGRPREGHYDDSYTLAPVAGRVSDLMQQEVSLVRSWEDGVSVRPGELVMLENIRFIPGEKSNDDELARRLAGLCDIYVNDAFATAHRAQASTHGVAKYAPVSCAGPLLLSEIETLSTALEQPARPMAAIVGGAKVSTKLTVLTNLIKKVDQLLVGGGIANTFLKAAGCEVGTSLHEPELVGAAADILAYAEEHNKTIPLPVDAVCAKAMAEDAQAEVKSLAKVLPDDKILDIGPKTIEANDRIIRSAASIVWNGPVGVFELEQFAAGTDALARAIAASPGLSIAGGGDTLSAIARFGVADGISCISTGGGAFLELLEGQTLPAVAVLQDAARALHKA